MTCRDGVPSNVKWATAGQPFPGSTLIGRPVSVGSFYTEAATAMEITSTPWTIVGQSVGGSDG